MHTHTDTHSLLDLPSVTELESAASARAPAGLWLWNLSNFMQATWAKKSKYAFVLTKLKIQAACDSMCAVCLAAAANRAGNCVPVTLRECNALRCLGVASIEFQSILAKSTMTVHSGIICRERVNSSSCTI